MTSPPAFNPTIRRQRLGRELKRLREAQSLRLEDIAAKLGVAPSTVSRIETGKAPTRTSYLQVMLDTYKLHDEQRHRFLMDLAREGQRKSRWTGHADLLPANAGPYLDLEATASHARIYSTQTLPGLLQTTEYTAAVCRAVQPGYTTNQITVLQSIQARRQELARTANLHIHLIIEESALLTPVGGDTVMASQLHHLLATTRDNPAITIQVAALATPRPAISPPFTALDFADQADTPVACYGPIAGQAILTTKADDIRTAGTIFASLAQTALPADESAKLIEHLTQASSGEWSADCR